MKLAKKMREIAESPGKAERIRRQKQEYEKIVKDINDAANCGYYHINIALEASSEIRKKLIDAGFIVSAESISW